MKQHEQKKAGHRQYDKLLVEILHKISNNVTREALLEYFSEELFKLSTVTYLVILEAYNEDITEVDDLSVLLLKDRNKNRNLLSQIKKGELRRRAEEKFSTNHIDVSFLNEILNQSTMQISWHSEWEKPGFFACFIPYSTIDKGGWMNIILLKRATSQHPSRFFFMWYPGSYENEPNNFAQDERVLYLFREYYEMASFKIKREARNIFEHRLELLKEIAPSIISHEILIRIRTIHTTMNYLLNDLEKVQTMQNSEDIKVLLDPYIDQIEHSILPGSHIIQDVADAISTGTKRSTSRQVVLRKLLQQVQDIFYHYLGKYSAGMRIECPDISASTDPALLIHVLLNLCMNALEAYEESELNHDRTIYIQVLSYDDQYIEILVSDDAIGIPEAMWERVFEQGKTSKSSGHGLGLTITRYITGFLGGEISVISPRPPHKTTFQILLPKESKKLSELEEEALYGKN